MTSNQTANTQATQSTQSTQATQATQANYYIDEYYPHSGQLELHKSTDKELVVISSIRAGKSYALIHEVIQSAWNNPTSHGLLVCAPTYKLVDSVLERPIVNKLLTMGLLKEHSFSRHETTLQNGNVIYYRSLEDPDISLRGLNIFKAIVDEATYCSKYSIDVVKGRLLTTNGQLILVGTPNGTGSWFYDHYIADRKTQVKYIKFKLTDNPIITNEAIERLYMSYDPLLAKQELEGEWVNLFANQVYYAFSDDNVGSYTPDPEGQVYIGLDFNIDKNAWVAIQKLPNNTYKVIKEGYGDKTTSDVANTILTEYPQAIVIPDATGANRVQGVAHTQFQLLRQAGINSLVEQRSNPRREERFAITNATFCNALNQHRLFIDQSCTRLIKELRELSYKESSSKVDDKGGEIGHISDALGYAIYYLTGRSIGKVYNPSSDFMSDWKARKRAYDAFGAL